MTTEEEAEIRAAYTTMAEADAAVAAKEDADREKQILEVAEASDLFNCDHGVEMGDPGDVHCMVSEGEDNGAYVRAWVWVTFEGTPLDKDAEKPEAEE